MPYEEREEIRLMSQSSRQAIALAIAGRWREAISVNQSIISNFPNDVNAYNRLGRAHMELGEYAQAKESYQKTLELDPYNVIARKNLQRFSQLGEPVASSAVKSADGPTAEPQYFIEEAGKAGIVHLHRPAPPEVLARMVAGDRVRLKIEGSTLVVENGSGECLGRVAPKHSQRLIKLMAGGNKYSAAIVSSMDSSVSVIIKEIYQDPSQSGQPSFPYRGIEEPRTSMGDMMFKREQEFGEETKEKAGYSIIDDEGIAVPVDEPLEKDEGEQSEDEE